MLPTDPNAPGPDKSESDASANADKKSTKRRPQSYLSKLCSELEKASDGLLHISEGDHYYSFFTFYQGDFGEPDGKLTREWFLSGFGISKEQIEVLKIPLDKIIEEISLDDFLPDINTLAEYNGSDISDPEVKAEAKKYKKLKTLLRKRLKDVKVFRVGKVEVRCYIAGVAEDGSIAGLVTTAIET